MFQRRSLIAALLIVAATAVVAANAKLTVGHNDEDMAAPICSSSKEPKLDKIEVRHPGGVRGIEAPFVGLPNGSITMCRGDKQ